MGRYFGYGRVSSSGQSTGSLAEQRDFLARRAREFQMEFVYFSEEKSGTTQKNRDVLQEVIAKAQPGDIIGVAYSDRFGRGGADDILLLYTLDERGIRVDINGRVFDAKNPEASLSEELMLIIASFYSRIQAQKARLGQIRAREDGSWLINHRLFGYHREIDGGRKLVTIVESEANVIRRIFELSAQGLSQPKICTALTAEGRLSRTSKPLRSPNIFKIVCNPVYMGYLVARPKVLDCGNPDRKNLTPEDLVRSKHYPAIVEPKTWWEVYLTRNRVHRIDPSKPRYQTRSSELTGLIECAWCREHGRRVTFIHAEHRTSLKSGAITTYPVYTSRLHVKGCPVVPKSFKAEVLENLFRCLFILVFENPREIEDFVRDEIKSRESSKEEIQKQLKDIRHHIEVKRQQVGRLEMAIVASTLDVHEIVRRRDDLLGEIHELESTVHTLLDPLQSGTQAFQAAVLNFTTESLRNFFGEVPSGVTRRRTYIAVFNSVLMTHEGLEVEFRNGKKFKVQTVPVSGPKYQDVFVVDKFFRGHFQEQIHVLVNLDPMGFSACTIDGSEATYSSLVDGIKNGEFPLIEAYWQLPHGLWETTEETLESLGLDTELSTFQGEIEMLKGRYNGPSALEMGLLDKPKE